MGINNESIVVKAESNNRLLHAGFAGMLAADNVSSLIAIFLTSPWKSRSLGPNNYYLVSVWKTRV